MTVIHQLSRLPARSGETGAIHRVIQSPLEEEQKVLTGDALHPGRAFEVVAKLSFEDEVDALYLLLLAQLLAIANECFTATQRVAVLSGRLRAAFFNRASRFIT